MASSLEIKCKEYFERLHLQEIVETNSDAKKAREKNLLEHSRNKKKPRRSYQFASGIMKVWGADIVANTALDHAVIKAFSNIPTPSKKQTFDFEYQFLMFNKKGFYSPSRPFLFPGNGGRISYDCIVGEKVDWSTVAAAAHSHPFYKGNRAVNRVNREFSDGDPSVVLIKQVPLYLRTPKADKIKVLEVRNNWLTTREVSFEKTHKARKWKPA